MASKRADIRAAVHEDMAARDFGGGPTEEVQERPRGGTTEVQERPNGPTKARGAVKVRLDPGDYSKLQTIAAGQGTTAAALVRLAVKECIKRAGRF